MSAEICRKSAREGVTQGAEGLPQGPRHAKALSRPESAAPGARKGFPGARATHKR